jgi:hypothetical protein
MANAVDHSELLVKAICGKWRKKGLVGGFAFFGAFPFSWMPITGFPMGAVK